jgi:hypothetical protein
MRELVLGVTLVGLAATAVAQSPPETLGVLAEKVLALFPRVDGSVLDVRPGAVTLSLGRRDGLLPGVGLELYREDRELRHPGTGQLLGRTEHPIGRALVKEVFEGYSTARVTEDRGVRAGDRARVPAGRIRLTILPIAGDVRGSLVEAATGELVQSLNRTGRFLILPGDALAVALDQAGVQRLDALEGEKLVPFAKRFGVENLLVAHFWQRQGKPYMDVRLFAFPEQSQVLVAGLFVPATIRTPPRNHPSTAPAGRSRPSRSLLARLLMGEIESGAYSAGEGSILMKEVAKFSFVVESMDVAVAPTDKIPRLVLTDGDRVSLYRMTPDRALEPEWTWNGRVKASVFAVQLADLDGDGTLEVVVNRYHPHERILVNGVILGTRHGKPIVLAEDIAQIMLAVDTHGEGIKRKLWGQDFAQTGFFKKGQADQLVLRRGTLVPEGRVHVPSIFRATGATFASIAGKDVRALVFVDEGGILRVVIGTESVWQSSTTVGGGGANLVVDTQTERGGRTYFYSAEPNPLAVDLDGDGIDEVVAAQNRQPGRLVVLYKGPAGYRLQSVDSGFDATVIGLGAIPDDPTPALVFAVINTYGRSTRSGDTRIIVTIPN